MLHKKMDEGEFQVIPDSYTSTVWRNLVSSIRSHPTMLFHDELLPLRDLFWELGAAHDAHCRDIVIPLDISEEPTHSLRPDIPSKLAPVHLIFGKIRDCEMNENGIRIREFSLTETVKKGIADLVEFVRIFPEGVLQDTFGYLYDFFVHFGVTPGSLDKAVLQVVAKRAKAASRMAKKELAIANGGEEAGDDLSSDEQVKQESDSSESSLIIRNRKKKVISSDEESQSSEADSDSEAEASSVVTSSEEEDIYCPSSEKSGIPRVPRAYRPWSLRQKSNEMNRRNGEVREERKRSAKANVSYKLRRSAAASAKARQVKVKPIKPVALPPVKAPKSFTFTYRLVPDHFKNCPILNCNSTFTTVDKAERHFRYNHPTEPLPPEIDDGQRFPCQFCTQDFKRERYLEYHLLQKHGDPVPTTAEAAEEAPPPPDPAPPVVRKPPTEPEYITVARYPCPHCTYMAPRTKAMIYHFVVKHPKEVLRMDTIQQVKIVRKRNEHLHYPPLEFPCPGCENSYSSKIVCHRHFIRTHGGAAKWASAHAAAASPVIKQETVTAVLEQASASGSTTVEGPAVTTSAVNDPAVKTDTKKKAVVKEVSTPSVVKEVTAYPVANEQPAQRAFKCTHCDKTFSRREYLVRHFARIHPPKVLIEDNISPGVNVKSKPLPNKSFTCPICNLTSTLLYTREALFVHFSNFHPNVDSSILSSRLDPQPNSAEETQADAVIETQSPILPATATPVVLEKSISSATSSENKPINRRRAECSICSKTISDRGNLLRHVRSHHPEADLESLGFYKIKSRRTNADSGHKLKRSPIVMPKLSPKPEIVEVPRKTIVKIEPRSMPKLSAKPDLPPPLEQRLKPPLRVYVKSKQRFDLTTTKTRQILDSTTTMSRQILDPKTTKPDLSATPSKSRPNSAPEQVSRPNLRVKPKPKQIFEPDTSTNRRKSKDNETDSISPLKNCDRCPYCERLFATPKAVRIHCRFTHLDQPPPRNINIISESEIQYVRRVKLDQEKIKPKHLLNGCISNHEHKVVPSDMLNGNSHTDSKAEAITISDEPILPPLLEAVIPVPDESPTLIQVEVNPSETANIATKLSSERDNFQPEINREFPNSVNQSHEIFGIASAAAQTQNTTNEPQTQPKLEMTSASEPKTPVKSEKLKAIDLLSPKEKEKLGKAIQHRLEKFILQKGVSIPNTESNPELKMTKILPASKSTETPAKIMKSNQPATVTKPKVVAAPAQSMSPHEEQDETEMHIVQIMEEMTTQVSEKVESDSLAPLNVQVIPPVLPQQQVAEVFPELPDISSELHVILDLDEELPELRELESEFPELLNCPSELPTSIGPNADLPEILRPDLSEILEIIETDTVSYIQIQKNHPRATETVKTQRKPSSSKTIRTQSTETSSSSVSIPNAEGPSTSSNKPSISDDQIRISMLGLDAPELQVKLIDCVKYPKTVEVIRKTKAPVSALPSRRIGPKIKFTGIIKNGKIVKGSPSPVVTQRLNSVVQQSKPKKIREPEPTFSSSSEDEEYFHEEPDLMSSEDDDYVPPSSNRKGPKSKILIYSDSDSDDSGVVPAKMRKLEKTVNTNTNKIPVRRLSIDSPRNSGKTSVPSHKRRLSDSNHNSTHVIKTKIKQSGR